MCHCHTCVRASRRDSNQWFDKFTVSNNGKAVLDVSMSNGQTVVKLDGKAVQTGKVTATSHAYCVTHKLSSS